MQKMGQSCIELVNAAPESPADARVMQIRDLTTAAGCAAKQISIVLI